MPLPDTMQAVVCHGAGDYRLEELPVPTPAAGEVVVKVLNAGVCAGDSKCHGGAPLFWGDEHRKGYCEPPCVPGHEFVGEVVALGEGAGDKHELALGDLAVSEQIVPCWQCRFCKSGKYWMCQQHDIYGFKHWLNGAMAEYMKFPADAINHRAPAGMDPKLAVLIEPLACSIHAVQRAEIELGDFVVIAGAGTLGLGMVGAARLKNPGALVVLDMMDSRLEIAKRLGADLVINPGKEDALQKVLDRTDGYGCDVYIEATGHPQGVIQGLHIVRRLGTFVEFSVFSGPTTVDWTLIGDTKELNIHGAHLSPYTYPLAIDYLHRGLIDGSALVTHQLPLAEFPKAFALVHEGKESIKVTLTP